MYRSVRALRHSLRSKNIQFVRHNEQLRRVDQPSGWIEAHRRLDRMLYEMMPATFSDVKQDNDGITSSTCTNIPRYVPQLVEELNAGMTGVEVVEEEGGILNYRICVKGFQPDTIKITVVADELRIDARLEERTGMQAEDGKPVSTHSRHMYRSFTLPPGLRPSDIRTVLDEEHLCISFQAPQPVQIPVGQLRAPRRKQ